MIILVNVYSFFYMLLSNSPILLNISLCFYLYNRMAFKKGQQKRMDIFFEASEPGTYTVMINPPFSSVSTYSYPFLGFSETITFHNTGVFLIEGRIETPSESISMLPYF